MAVSYTVITMSLYQRLLSRWGEPREPPVTLRARLMRSCASHAHAAPHDNVIVIVVNCSSNHSTIRSHHDVGASCRMTLYSEPSTRIYTGVSLLILILILVLNFHNNNNNIMILIIDVDDNDIIVDNTDQSPLSLKVCIQPVVCIRPVTRHCRARPFTFTRVRL